MTAQLDKPRLLAAEALRAAIDGRPDAAGRYLQRLHDECGWDGLSTATLALCDVVRAHMTNGDMRPVKVHVASMVVETGAIDSKPRDTVAWATRLIEARLAMDRDAYEGACADLNAHAEAGPYIAELLYVVAHTIRSFPRGYAVMGREIEQATP